MSLILVMIYEFMQGDNSKWKPYFDIMPESFDTLMFWPRTELGGLQASAISAKIGKDEADNMFRAKVLPVVEEHAHIFYPEGSKRMNEEELLNLAHRMGSTVMYGITFPRETKSGSGFTNNATGLMHSISKMMMKSPKRRATSGWKTRRESC